MRTSGSTDGGSDHSEAAEVDDSARDRSLSDAQCSPPVRNPALLPCNRPLPAQDKPDGCPSEQLPTVAASNGRCLSDSLIVAEQAFTKLMPS